MYAEAPEPPLSVEVQPADAETEVDAPAGQPPEEQPPVEQSPVEQPAVEEVEAPYESAAGESSEPAMQEITLEVIEPAAQSELRTDSLADAEYQAYFLSDYEISVWDLKRKGVEIDGENVNPNEQVKLIVRGGQPETLHADSRGRVNVLLQATAGPDAYSVKLVAASLTLTDTLTVISDASKWSNFTDTPYVSSP